jgi:hypothetical protein
MLRTSYQIENGSLVKVYTPTHGNGPFTLDEDEYLFRNYNKQTLKELSRFMLRPVRTIECRLKKLDLQKHPNWKQEDISLLYQGFDNATLAMKLGRSTNAIKIMKTRLRLCKQHLYTTHVNCYIV